MPRRFVAAAILALTGAAAIGASSVADYERTVDDARRRWADSLHGPMLERILPPTYDAERLPEPGSEGAKLLRAYCVQCHNLPNPAMHHAAKWPGIVRRMVLRMEGKGNMGTLMSEMMAGVKAPAAEDTRTLIAYLRRHAQRALDPRRYPEVNQPSGEAFRLACNQCHVLPDPRRYTAAEWPRVVARMQENMEWMNRVVGSKPVPGEPRLAVEAINAFLAKYARKPGG
jgi:cytochrome c5